VLFKPDELADLMASLRGEPAPSRAAEGAGFAGAGFDSDGFDSDGFDSDGFDSDGFDAAGPTDGVGPEEPA
jgi:hypothetical protein